MIKHKNIAKYAAITLSVYPVFVLLGMHIHMLLISFYEGKPVALYSFGNSFNFSSTLIENLLILLIIINPFVSVAWGGLVLLLKRKECLKLLTYILIANFLLYAYLYSDFFGYYKWLLD